MQESHSCISGPVSNQLEDLLTQAQPLDAEPLKTMGRRNNSSALVMTVGKSPVLTCSFNGNIALLIWTIAPKAGGLCTLVHRADKNETHRTTCSDNINLIFREDLPPALEIRQVGLAQEGNYSCEAATTEGNFHTRYHLTMLAPPRLSLSCDEQGSPVCEAAAGKPPAQLSWAPEGSSTAEEKCHDNGTVTVLSKFTACSTSVSSVITCMVSHPAGNWSQSIACCPSEKTGFFLPCVISLIGLMSLLFLLAAFELYIFFNSALFTESFFPKKTVLYVPFFPKEHPENESTDHISLKEKSVYQKDEKDEEL
ncbi:cell surface glycoprotein CD200 receptor 1-B-like [Melozone crissalis]|uniref:cell surface glycoprotein CD200 receptor 1-B-like n=1 Tax=Melozone crissalis TaxID=40204 RepID=UPI0023DA6B6A|nr:cell surface glycoprotein CD200 receptor 1-B-like [Melozone crissalis]